MESDYRLRRAQIYQDYEERLTALYLSCTYPEHAKLRKALELEKKRDQELELLQEEFSAKPIKNKRSNTIEAIIQEAWET